MLLTGEIPRKLLATVRTYKDVLMSNVEQGQY